MPKLRIVNKTASGVTVYVIDGIQKTAIPMGPAGACTREVSSDYTLSKCIVNLCGRGIITAEFVSEDVEDLPLPMDARNDPPVEEIPADVQAEVDALVALTEEPAPVEVVEPVTVIDASKLLDIPEPIVSDTSILDEPVAQDSDEDQLDTEVPVALVGRVVKPRRRRSKKKADK